MRRTLSLGIVLIFGVGCTQTSQWVNKQLPGSNSIVEIPAQSLPTSSEARAVDTLPTVESGKLSLAMAESLDKEGKEIEAIAYYEKARSEYPGSNERCSRRLAVLYDRCDEQAKAMNEFTELLKSNPKDSNLLNDVGYSYYNRGQWAIAEDHLRRSVTADKKNKRAWTNLGLALAQQEKYAEAVNAFEKAISPADTQANIAFVMLTQGKREEAKLTYERALAIEPQCKLAQEGLLKLNTPKPTPPAPELPVSPIEPKKS
ncbi:MAG: tetratricopeptide repeat protein [Gemmataceae bacterium]